MKNLIEKIGVVFLLAGIFLVYLLLCVWDYLIANFVTWVEQSIKVVVYLTIILIFALGCRIIYGAFSDAHGVSVFLTLVGIFFMIFALVGFRYRAMAWK